MDIFSEFWRKERFQSADGQPIVGRQVVLAVGMAISRLVAKRVGRRLRGGRILIAERRVCIWTRSSRPLAVRVIGSGSGPQG